MYRPSLQILLFTQSAYATTIFEQYRHAIEEVSKRESLSEANLRRVGSALDSLNSFEASACPCEQLRHLLDSMTAASLVPLKTRTQMKDGLVDVVKDASLSSCTVTDVETSRQVFPADLTSQFPSAPTELPILLAAQYNIPQLMIPRLSQLIEIESEKSWSAAWSLIPSPLPDPHFLRHTEAEILLLLFNGVKKTCDLFDFFDEEFQKILHVCKLLNLFIQGTSLWTEADDIKMFWLYTLGSKLKE